MMKILAVLCIVGSIFFGLSGSAHAFNSAFFDFEDGVNQVVETPGLTGLTNYMSNIFGAPVNPFDSQWFGHADIFNSDAIKTFDRNSKIDFDHTQLPDQSTFKILSVSFDWAVYQASSAKDFALDVYDDLTEVWIKNVFFVRDASDGDSGFSGLITFDNSWEITKIKFHDADQFDVGMDNLTINYNSLPVASIPEPSSLLLLSLGLLGLLKRFKKFS